MEVLTSVRNIGEDFSSHFSPYGAGQQWQLAIRQYDLHIEFSAVREPSAAQFISPSSLIHEHPDFGVQYFPAGGSCLGVF